MDLLMAEIARKRKSVERAKSSAKVFKTNSGRSSKSKKRQYFRSSDLRRFEEEGGDDEGTELSQTQEQSQKAKKQRVAESEDENLVQSKKKFNMNGNNTTRFEDESKEKLLSKLKDLKQNKTSSSSTITQTKLTSYEITTRLRSIGQPIRLFGESLTDDTQREARLLQTQQSIQKALSGKSDMDDFRLGSGHGIRNTFLQEDEETNQKNKSLEKSTDNRKQNSKDGNKSNGNITNINADNNRQQEENEIELAKDPHKHIYKFFKNHLKLWEADLLERPDHVRRTAAGKNETKTLKQCRDYIRPLFKLCKTRRLEPFLLESIHKIVLHCQEGEFVFANNVYNDVAIGRAAWPIGVTMVSMIFCRFNLLFISFQIF